MFLEYSNMFLEYSKWGRSDDEHPKWARPPTKFTHPGKNKCVSIPSVQINKEVYVPDPQFNIKLVYNIWYILSKKSSICQTVEFSDTYWNIPRKYWNIARIYWNIPRIYTEAPNQKLNPS